MKEKICNYMKNINKKMFLLVILFVGMIIAFVLILSGKNKTELNPKEIDVSMFVHYVEDDEINLDNGKKLCLYTILVEYNGSENVTDFEINIEKLPGTDVTEKISKDELNQLFLKKVEKIDDKIYKHYLVECSGDLIEHPKYVIVNDIKLQIGVEAIY